MKLVLLTVLLSAAAFLFVEFATKPVSPDTQRPEGESPLAERLAQSPQEIAEELGYRILAIEPGDRLGRTVVYDGRGTFDGTSVVKTGQGKEYIVGRVSSLAKAGTAGDSELRLEDPMTGSFLTSVRLSAASEVPTELHLERLELSGYNPEASLVFTLDKLEFRELSRFIRAGDVVAVIPKSEEAEGMLAESVVIRRFGNTLDQP